MRFDHLKSLFAILSIVRDSSESGIGLEISPQEKEVQLFLRSGFCANIEACVGDSCTIITPCSSCEGLHEEKLTLPELHILHVLFGHDLFTQFDVSPDFIKLEPNVQKVLASILSTVEFRKHLQYNEDNLLKSLGFGHSLTEGRERYSLLFELVQFRSRINALIFEFLACDAYYFLRDRTISNTAASQTCEKLLQNVRDAITDPKSDRVRILRNSLSSFYDDKTAQTNAKIIAQHAQSVVERFLSKDCHSCKDGCTKCCKTCHQSMFEAIGFTGSSVPEERYSLLFEIEKSHGKTFREISALMACDAFYYQISVQAAKEHCSGLLKEGELGLLPMATSYGQNAALENLGKRLQLMYYDDNDWIAEKLKSAIGIYTTEENCRQCTSSAPNCDHCFEVLLTSLGFEDAEPRRETRSRYSLLLQLMKYYWKSSGEILQLMACDAFYYLRDKGSVEGAKDKCSQLLNEGRLAAAKRLKGYTQLQQFYDTT
jgi:hypothetical protein